MEEEAKGVQNRNGTVPIKSVRLAPLPVTDRAAGHMGGHDDAGGHTGDPHIPATELVATRPEADVHATAHMSHISWGRAGPAVSIKNGAAADDDFDLVVVGSRSLLYHPEDVKETERHLFCTVYQDSSGKPVEIARTPWSRLRDPYWNHGVKFQNFAHSIASKLCIVVWSIHHDQNNPEKTSCLVVGHGTIQSSVISATTPQLAWVPVKMPPTAFKVKRPIANDLRTGFAGGSFKGADGENLPQSVSDRLGPADEMGQPAMHGHSGKGADLPNFGSGQFGSSSRHLAACAPGMSAGSSSVKDMRRQSHAHNATEEAEDSTSLKLAIYGVVLIAVYFVVVCAFYVPVEGWTIRECLYFAVVTFTTVGYGDYTPTGDGSKLFTCIVALLGVSFIAVGVGVIGQEVVRVQQKLIDKGREAASHAVHSQFTEETDEDGKKAIAHINEHHAPPNALVIIFWAFVPVVTVIGIHAAVVGHIEKWTFVDAVYISTITGTSVGYGELYPKEPLSQWFSIFSIPVMVFCISYALGRVARIPVQHEMNKLHKKMLAIEITEEDFELMGNGDGDIDRTEFIVHMLKAMKKVDDVLIDKLMDRFNKLDADGSGFISKDELKEVWQRKKEKTEGTEEAAAWSKLRKSSLSLGTFKRAMAQGPGPGSGSGTGTGTGTGKVAPIEKAQVAADLAAVAAMKSRLNTQEKSKTRGGSNRTKHFQHASQYTPMGSFAGTG